MKTLKAILNVTGKVTAVLALILSAITGQGVSEATAAVAANFND